MKSKNSKSLPRLYVSAPLGEGKVVILEKQQGHYLRAVMRLIVSDEVILFNGVDGEWRASIATLSKKVAKLACMAQLRDQTSQGDLWYLFAPLKQARLDYIVQKATEMGASRIQPVKTAYTQIGKIKEERLRANAVEAAEQCNLLTVPEIGSYTSLEKILDSWPEDRILIFCNETLKSKTPLDQLKKLDHNSYALLIGPEGGFSKDEIRMIENNNFVASISLGPRVLRADTAGVAALTLIQATKGDW